MKKQLLIIFLTSLCSNGFAQILFEKGYFIDNAGHRTECLIKNKDWKNNPTKFDYKLFENSELMTASMDSVQEFGILNTSRYKRFRVKIDRSSEGLKKATSRNPEFMEETLYLKFLVEGEANLYVYEDGNLKRYFFTIDDSAVEQLIYRTYRTTDNELAKNDAFRQQLWNNLKCDGISLADAENTDYVANDLIKFFAKYNSCKTPNTVNVTKKQSKEWLHVTIRPGLNWSSLTITNDQSDVNNADFGSKLGFRLGSEFEFILPYNKGKWAILVEPTYQYFNAKVELTAQTVSVNYKSIELPLGVRHYFFIKESESKIFINASYVLDFDINSKVDYETRPDLDIKTSTITNLTFGIGYSIKSRYSTEIRYGLNRNILGDYTFWGSEFNTLSFILGYRVLRN